MACTSPPSPLFVLSRKVLTLLALQTLTDAVEMHARPALFYECFTGNLIQWQDAAFSTTAASKSVLKEFVEKYGGPTKERVRSSVHCLQAYLMMLTFAIASTRTGPTSKPWYNTLTNESA